MNKNTKGLYILFALIVWVKCIYFGLNISDATFSFEELSLLSSIRILSTYASFAWLLTWFSFLYYQRTIAGMLQLLLDLWLIANRLRRRAAGQVPANAAGLLLHVAKQRLGPAQIVVNALAADAQLLADLAEGQILIIAKLKAFALTRRQQVAVVIIQQNQFQCIHGSFLRQVSLLDTWGIIARQQPLVKCFSVTP